MIVFLLVVGIFLTPHIVHAKNPLLCLADNIYFEARGEPEAGQFLVGFITLNRVRDSRWPNDICKVVYQPGQFNWTFDKHPNKPYKSEVYYRIIYIASVVMQAKEIEDYGYYFNTTHAKSKSLLVVGNHRFY